jgi:hypothetical protein
MQTRHCLFVSGLHTSWGSMPAQLNNVMRPALALSLALVLLLSPSD